MPFHLILDSILLELVMQLKVCDYMRYEEEQDKVLDLNLDKTSFEYKIMDDVMIQDSLYKIPAKRYGQSHIALQRRNH